MVWKGSLALSAVCFWKTLWYGRSEERLLNNPGIFLGLSLLARNFSSNFLLGLKRLHSLTERLLYEGQSQRTPKVSRELLLYISGSHTRAEACRGIRIKVLP